MPIPVVITVFQDRSFTFVTKTPPVSYFLKKAAGIEAGAKTVGTQIVGKVTMAQVARDRQAEDAGSQRERHRSRRWPRWSGSARSMGLQVVE